MSDDEDLIGEAPRRRGRPTNAEKAAREERQRQELENALRVSQAKTQGKSPLGDAYGVHRGVNVTWLVVAFRMDIKTVRRKLANVTPIGTGHRGAEIYDFAEAASYLAKPPPDQLASFLRGLRVQDLPVQLQDPYWSAMRKRQLYMEHAGDLWPTEGVMDVFGEAFKTIKSTMQLWVDNLDNQAGLTTEQRALVTKLVDGLQDEIYHKLVEMPKQRRTPNSSESPEANPSPAASVPDDEDLVG